MIVDFSCLALLGLLFSHSAAQSGFPVTVELDLINPMPGKTYENHGQPFPITFAIRNVQVAHLFGYSFKWTIHSNVTNNLPSFYDEGASIGSPPTNKSIDISVPETTIWQSLTYVFQTYQSQSDRELDFYLYWEFTFSSNCTRDSYGVSSSPVSRRTFGTIPFSTRPGANQTANVNVGGASGNCPHLLKAIPIVGNLSSGSVRACPELGDITDSDVRSESSCGFRYTGQTTTGTQLELTALKTIDAMSGTAVASMGNGMGSTASTTSGVSVSSAPKTSLSIQTSATSSAPMTASSKAAAGAERRTGGGFLAPVLGILGVLELLLL